MLASFTRLLTLFALNKDICWFTSIINTSSSSHYFKELFNPTKLQLKQNQSVNRRLTLLSEDTTDLRINERNQNKG